MSDAGHGPWARRQVSAADRLAFAEASATPFWLDSPQHPEPRPALEGGAVADLAIVGAGLSGLWAAVLAKERDPGRDVLVLEAAELAGAASGRNGGFLSSFLTHGVANGMARFPEEMPTLERLGLENFAATREAIGRYGIECGLETGGDIDVAVEPHEVPWLAEEAEALRRLGHEVEVLDREQVRDQVHSPIYEGGLWRKSGAAIVDPARLCWGLARTAERLGVRVHERTAVERIRPGDSAVRLATSSGAVEADRVLLATSAYHGLVGEIRRRVVPVWDYVLVTEPLSASQLESIGWRNRQGIGDMANRFHYYRLTEDDRILWGGFDAIYRYASGLEQRMEQNERAFASLAAHFFTAFPQLEGVRFSHRWGGAIDTCSRFFAFQGTALGGRVAYTVGHTGLGVGASRFGAGVALDLLAGRETEATRLRAIRSRPFPFPPEPLRWAAIELTRNRLAAADRRAGRRGIWLRTLDRLGLGFDS
jgi:glycine/D-amino acid oxidase-like deaminating enzyme